MTPTSQTEKLAELIASGQFLPHTHEYFILAALLILTTSFAAYLGSYWTNKAKIDLIESKQEQILNQLKATTKATEEIKSHYRGKDWIAQERNQVKRQKLEEICSIIQKLPTNLMKSNNHTYEDIDFAQEYAEQALELEMVMRIYQPELQQSLAPLIEALGEFTQSQIRVCRKVSESKVEINTITRAELSKEKSPLLQDQEKLQQYIDAKINYARSDIIQKHLNDWRKQLSGVSSLCDDAATACAERMSQLIDTQKV